MKLIIFYIRPERLNTVKQEFCKRNIFKMSVGNALGCGQRKTKNCTNVLFKSIQVPAIGFLAGAIAGFSLICPGESNWMIGKVFGFSGFGMGNETMTLMTGAADPVKRRGGLLTTAENSPAGRTLLLSRDVRRDRRDYRYCFLRTILDFSLSSAGRDGIRRTESGPIQTQ